MRQHLTHGRWHAKRDTALTADGAPAATVPRIKDATDSHAAEKQTGCQTEGDSQMRVR